MIERLIKRCLKGISILSVVKNLSNLIDGIAVEFYRLMTYRDEIKSCVVPNVDMSVNSIDDYNVMFGIPSSLDGTDAEKVARILEKADFFGYPGKDWLQSQIRKAGFDLYVIENTVQTQTARQWGTFEFALDLQFGITERFISPFLVPGELIVNQPYTGLGRIYLTQYGPGILDVYSSMYGSIQFGEAEFGTISQTIIMQYGTAGLQFGTPDLSQTFPRAKNYELTTNAMYYGFYFFLSPFPDRLATPAELLPLSVDQFNYLRSIIISSKLVRNWCIAQVSIS